MKKLILILLILPLIVHSQAKLDSVNGIIYVKEVRQIDMPYKKLKNKAFDWIAKSYNNSNFVTRINEDDKILTKGSFDVNAIMSDIPMNPDMKVNTRVNYDLDLEFKDGRYKIEVNNISYKISDTPEINNLKVQLMSFEQFKEHSIQEANNYDGPGKKAYLKSVQNDNKLERTYNRNKDFWDQIIEQTMIYVSNLENSIHSYMKSDQGEDW